MFAPSSSLKQNGISTGIRDLYSSQELCERKFYPEPARRGERVMREARHRPQILLLKHIQSILRPNNIDFP